MAISPTEVRNFFGGLENVTDSALDLYIGDAERRVVTDGVASTHPDYNTLVRYAIGVTLKSGGFIAGEVTEEQVADVRVKFGTGGSGESGTLTWEQCYEMVLNRICGFEGRVVF